MKFNARRKKEKSTKGFKENDLGRRDGRLILPFRYGWGRSREKERITESPSASCL